MPDVHARFSPSSSERLIRCPPSLRLSEECGIKDEGSVYAQEGTEAHSLCEYLLHEALGIKTKDPRPGMEYYDQEMQECAEGYRDAVLEIYEKLKKSGDVSICVEQRVDFSRFVKGGFGTSDCVIIGEGHLYVVDFKYGRGVPVDATDNSQLKCYALGAYEIFSPLYDFDEIHLVIYQPRISNYSEWSLTPEALLSWAESVLSPAADLAFRGGGEYSCGPWCRFCRAKPICRKRAEENLKLAQYDFARPDTLEEDEINLILSKIEDLINWANDIKDYALSEALRGKPWDDWKVVEGRANRKYTDENRVAQTVTAAGFDPYEKKILSVSALEKKLGKKRFQELIGSFVTRPQGSPTLVPRTDKRPEFNITVADFNE